MRTIPAAAQTLIDQFEGTEPLIIVEIEWTTNSFTRYAFKKLTDNIGDLLNISSIDDVINLAKSSNTKTVSVSIYDENNFVKDLMDTKDIHKSPAKVYLSFPELSLANSIVLFDGEVNSPIVWDEHSKELNLDILSPIENAEVGFAPESGQFEFVPESLEGKVWPLVFGTPMHVLATKSTDIATATLLEPFGQPDSTIPIKLRVLETLRASILAAFGYQQNLATYIDTYFNRPKDIQYEYAETIVGEDTQKQLLADRTAEIEQINKQLDELIELWEEAQREDLKNELASQIIDIREQHRDLMDQTVKIANILVAYEYTKDRIELDADNAKYAYDVLGQIKESQGQLIEDFITTVREIKLAQNAINRQAATVKSQVALQGSEVFEQDTELTFTVNGLNIRGVVSEGKLTIRAVVPSYTNIVLNPAEEEDVLDAVWVNDEAIDLDGMYCYMNNHRIIKLSKDEGAKYTFELVKKEEELFDITDRIEVTGDNKDAIKETLSDLLENVTDLNAIQKIINEIPQDISTAIWNILNGGIVHKQQLVLVNPPEDHDTATFKLVYQEDETAEIKIDDDHTEIRKKILAMPCFQSLKDHPTKIEVSGGPLLLIPEDNENKKNILGTPIIITFNLNLWTKDDPLPPVMRMFSVNNDGMRIGHFLDQDDKAPYILVNRISEGAHEKTAQEIASAVDNLFSGTIHGNELNELQQKIAEFQKNINTATTANAKEANKKAMIKVMDQYNELILKTQIPMSELAEIYALISDEEYKVLFSMELLHYMNWKKSFEPIPVELENDPATYLYTNLNFTRILEASPIILPRWISGVSLIQDVKCLPESTAFLANVGDLVQLEGSNQVKYIANILPSTVKGVYGKRVVNGIERLTPIPSRLYTVNESEDMGDLTVTSVTLLEPLETFESFNWVNDELYVTLESSVGPNVIDILKWIIDNYTTFTHDNVTFDAVHTKLVNYPAHFALLEKKNALELIQEIAWQSRCAVFLNGKQFTIRYLSETPDTVFTVDNTRFQMGNLKLELSSTEEIITHIQAEWRMHGAEEKPNLVNVRYNVRKYGEKTEVKDFFIYNDAELVRKSATFWLIRMSNSWKKIRTAVALDSVCLETGDPILLDCGIIPEVIGEIEEAVYEPMNNQLNLLIWTPIRCGELNAYNFAFPSSIETDTVFPANEEVIAGQPGSPYNVNVPTGSDWEFEAVEFRPKDYGTLKLSDASDNIPKNPASNVVEVDYQFEGVGEGITIPSSPLQNKDQSVTTTPIAKGKKETTQFLFGFARVRAKLEGEPVVVPEPFGESENVNQIYEVELFNGEQKRATLLQVHKDEILPYNMVVFIAYDPFLAKYLMQVPIYNSEGFTITE